MAPGVKGNCYLCGVTLGKTAMNNHIMEAHAESSGDQVCYLLKIESTHNRNYWLYVDVPVMSTVKRLDNFLREIWLNSSEPLSAFYRQDHSEINMGHKIGKLTLNSQIKHKYDLASLYESTIIVEGRTKRKRQVKAVRLLARNAQKIITCAICGQPAAVICIECMREKVKPYLCETCLGEHEHSDRHLPISNSPRIGVCTYDGTSDV